MAAVQPVLLPPPAAPAEWPPLTRAAFRFAFCYLGLYSLIAFSNVIEFIPYERLWQGIVPWMGLHVLHLSKPITYFPSGSGDKTSDWVLLFCHLVLSVAATAVWSIFDRRTEYRRLNEWLRVTLRYALAATMVAYGSVKVVKLQFPDPSFNRLLEPFRDFSPMGLLWTFMGFSTPYTFFAGAIELAGGVLLFFRRTTTLGALLTAVAMTNVAILNYAYDTPVKLLSTHLVLMCGYLLIPDLRAMFEFFVRNRPAVPSPAQPLFTDRRWRIAGRVAKILFLGYLAVTSVIGMIQGYSLYGAGRPRPPIYGIWSVEEFSRDGVTVAPLLTETGRWRWFAAQYTNMISIRQMNDKTQTFQVRFDTAHSTILNDNGQTAVHLAWSRPDADRLTLTGTVGGQQISASLKRVDLDKTNLLGRGFHWVSELPFNR